MQKQLKINSGIIITALIVFLFGIISTSYNVFQLQKAIGLSSQIINNTEINHSLEEEYRIQISYWSKIYGADLNKALAIVKAESNFKNICNYESCRFGQGIFMFIQSTWEGTGIKMGQVTGDTMDPYLNIQRGIYLLKTEGDYHWDMSKHNWK